MPVKIARSAPRASFGLPELLVASTPRVSLATRPEKREYSRQFGSHPGSPGFPALIWARVAAIRRSAVLLFFPGGTNKMFVHALMGAESTPGPPVIRTIGVMDLKDALARGMSDFSAMPTHAFFLCLIYPIFGLILARMSLGYDVLSVLFPLAAGFALLGPFASIGFYELSRQREQGLEPSWPDAFDVLHSPSRDAIAALGFLLLAIFVFWLGVAEAIYIETFGHESAASIRNFVGEVFTTRAGWTLIIVGNGIGFLFALAVLIISVVSFPLLLDRDVGAVEAVLTSVRAVASNPAPMAVWGLIVAGLLVVGSLPLFVGLAVVVPVLGHATWHLYRKVVEADPNARHEHPHPPKSRHRHYAAQFPASLFGGEEPPRPPPLKPVFDPATGRWRASRTGHPEIILAGIATGTVYTIVATFFLAEVWTALAVVFVAAPLVFITAIILAAKS